MRASTRSLRNNGLWRIKELELARVRLCRLRHADRLGAAERVVLRLSYTAI